MADDKEAQEKQEQALKQMKLLLMIVLVLAVVVPMLSTTMAVKSIDEKLASLKVGKHQDEESHDKKEKLPMAFYKPMEFLVNLGDSDANHYLRSTVSLGLRLTEHDVAYHAEHNKGGGGHGGGEEEAPQPVLFKTIKVQEPIVRDIIISIISNATMDELVSATGKQTLKETIRKRLRDHFSNEDLEIYFTAFTLQ